MNTVLQSFGLLAVFLLMVMPVHAAQPGITYFNANDPNSNSCLYGFIRSTSPIRDSSSTFSIFQRGNLHGAVVTSVSTQDAGQDVSAGFTIYDVGKLSDISTITITADPNSFSLTGSASFNLNLWLDVDGKGYFEWLGNCLTGLGGTVYGLGPGGTSNVLTVNSATSFFLVNYHGPPWSATLADLKAGTVPGINPASTEVAIWVGIYLSGKPNTGSGNAVVAPDGISIS